jgi:hypothetical protein
MNMNKMVIIIALFISVGTCLYLATKSGKVEINVGEKIIDDDNKGDDKSGLEINIGGTIEEDDGIETCSKPRDGIPLSNQTELPGTLPQ